MGHPTALRRNTAGDASSTVDGTAVGSALMPRARTPRTVLTVLAIMSLLVSLTSPVSARIAAPRAEESATLATHTASDFFIFAKAAYGKITEYEGFDFGETPICDGAQDLTASVSGSDNVIFDRIHSNADWNGGGQNNTFLDAVTYGTHAENCTNDPGDNTYPAGSPGEIDGPPEVLGAHGWPGTLGNSLNADGLTFSTIEQVLGVGATCDHGTSLSSGDFVIFSPEHDNSTICGGPSSTITLGEQGIDLDITVVSHGKIDFNASDSTLRPWKHGILAWTDKDSFADEHPFKLQGSNFHVGPAIVFTPRAGQDISGSTGSEDCIQHIGQGQIKVQGSSSFFGTGACGGQPNLNIAKSTSTPVITAGDVASYTVTVNNTGTAVATGVVITDTLPSGVTWGETSPSCEITGGFNLSCGPMDIPGPGSFSVTVTGTTDAGECPSISNTASYTSTNAGSGNTEATPTVITVNCPDIDIEKEPDEGDSGNDVNAGDTATFTLRTSNTAAAGTASGVKLIDTLPVAQNGWAISASTWPASPDPAACVITGAPAAAQTLTCGGASGVSLAALAFLDVSVTTTTDGGAIPNDCGGFNNPESSATSTNAGSDTDPGEIDVLCAAINIEKTPDEDAADPSANDVTAGQAASFTLRTSNNGPGTATGVKLNDTLPVAQNGWTITTNWSADEAIDCDIAGDPGTAQVLTCGGATGISLAASAFIDVVVSTVTDGGALPNDCGGFNNPDAVATSGNNGSDTDAGEIDVLCPDIEVDKTPDQGDLGSVITAGDFGSFTITTSNEGTGAANGVTLFDNLLDLTNLWQIVDAGTTWTTCAITNPPADAPDLGQVLNCGPETILAGGELVVTVRVLTAAADCDLQTDVRVVPNRADASSTNDGSDFDTGQLTINCPDIEVDKTPDQGDLGSVITAGDFGSFTITTSNEGTGAANGVTLFDNLLDLTNLWQIVDAGTTWTTCAITNPPADAPDLGQVLNCGPETILAGGELVVTVRVLTAAADCDLQTDVRVVPNRADASSTNDGSDFDTGQLTINCPDIEVDKTPDQGDLGSVITAGDFGSFTITTSNEGTGAANGVTLFDNLLDLTNLWQIVDAGTTWTTCAITNPPADAPDLGQVLNCGPETILAGGELVVTVRVLTAAADCDLQTDVRVVPNRADASSTNDGSDFDTGQLTINCPDIEVDKTPDQGDLGSVITAGDFGSFTITTSNEGTGAANGVTLFDNLLDLTNLWQIVDAGTTWTTCAITNPPADAPDLGQVLNCGPETILAGGELVVTVRVLTAAADCDLQTDVRVVPNRADASSTNDGSDFDTGQLTINCPDIEVDKTPDQGDLGSVITAGDFGSFTITTSNEGTGAANGVTLFDNLLDLTNLWQIVDAGTTWTTCAITNPPADAPDLGQVLNCGPETILAGGELVVTVRVLTAAADCDLQTDVRVVPNRADASSTNDGSDFDTGQLTINCPDIEVDKTPDQGDLGSVITAGDFGSFTITTSNEGTGAANGVTLFDNLLDLTNLWQIVDAGTTWTTCAITNPPADAPDLGQVLNCGPETILAGGELVVTVRVLTAAADCDLQTDVRVVPNRADASSTNDGSDFDTGQLTINCPDLLVSKAASTLEILAPSTLTYTITATNDGEGTAADVTVSDDLDNDLEITSATFDVDPGVEGGTGDCSVTLLTNVVSCDVGDLAASDGLLNGPDTVVVTIVADVPVEACPSVSNQASVSATNESDAAAEDNLSEEVVVDVSCPDVSVEKLATDPVISSTQNASFTITVNGGALGTVEDVILTDVLPAGFTWTVGGADIEDCSAVGLALPEDDEVAGGTTLTCNFGPLGPEETRTITLTATTAEDDCDLTISNTAVVSTDGDTNPTNNSSTATVEVECPALTPLKTADNVLVNAGQQIGFTITLSNSAAEGTGIAFNATINDPLPIGPGIDWDIDPATDGCHIDGDAPAAETLVCDFGDLDPGESHSVHVVSGTTLATCETYENHATADADNHAPVTADASLTVQCPGRNIAKEAVDGSIAAGEIASFTIVLWNTGPGTALGVTLTDTLPGDLDWSENSEACSISAGVLSCNFGDLGVTTKENSPARVTLTALTDRTDCGVLDNTAIMDTNPGDPIPSSASITVRCPSVAIVKTNNQSAPVLPGTNVTFTLTVTVTDGPAEDVIVVDTLPAGYDAPTNTNGGIYNPTTRKITWELGTLDTGPHAVTYQAAVSAGVAHGTQLVNVAVVTSPGTNCPPLELDLPAAVLGGEADSPCDDDSIVTVRVPTLVIDKAASIEQIVISGPSGAQVATPSSVTWTLSYTLTNGPVTNAVITDPVPTGFIFVSASNGGAHNPVTNAITWTFPELTTSGSVTFVTNVDVATISRTGPTTNVATIDSDQTPPDTGQDSVTVAVEEPPLGGTPTPRPSLPNTATGSGLNGEALTVPVELLAALFLSSLGALVLVNVRATRRRR